MNQAYVGRYVLYLVCLQVPYEVPFYVLWQYGLFLPEFLHVAFAKDALSGIVCLLYHLGRMVLAHGTQLHPLRQGAEYGLYSFRNHFLFYLLV
jgi:hypothetical protein